MESQKHYKKVVVLLVIKRWENRAGGGGFKVLKFEVFQLIE